MEPFFLQLSSFKQSRGLNKGGGRGKGGGGMSTDNLNINKQGVLKLFSVKSGNSLSLIMGIALAKSWCARGVSQQPAFMGSCLTISHTSHYLELEITTVKTI